MSEFLKRMRAALYAYKRPDEIRQLAREADEANRQLWLTRVYLREIGKATTLYIAQAEAEKALQIGAPR